MCPNLCYRYKIKLLLNTSFCFGSSPYTFTFNTAVSKNIVLFINILVCKQIIYDIKSYIKSYILFIIKECTYVGLYVTVYRKRPAFLRQRRIKPSTTLWGKGKY